MDNGNVVYDGEEMESFAQIAQGHINAAALDHVPGAYASPAFRMGIDPKYAAPEPLGFELHFGNMAEFRAHEASRYHFKAVTDPTYPITDEQDVEWVKATMHCMLNTGGVIDGDKMKTQWKNIMDRSMSRVEAMAWTLVRQVKRYHLIDDRLDPTNPETAKAKKQTCFKTHMHILLDAMLKRKTICRHLTYFYFLNTFIDGPNQTLTRIGANQRVNNSKKRKSQLGAAAAEIMASRGQEVQADEVEKFFAESKKRARATRAAVSKKRRRVSRKGSTSTTESSEFSLELSDDVDGLSETVSPTQTQLVNSQIDYQPRGSTRVNNQTRYSLRRRGAKEDVGLQHDGEEDSSLEAHAKAEAVSGNVSPAQPLQTPYFIGSGKPSMTVSAMGGPSNAQYTDPFWYMNMNGAIQSPSASSIGHAYPANAYPATNNYNYYPSGDSSDMFSMAPLSSTTDRSFFSDLSNGSNGVYGSAPSTGGLNGSFNPYAGIGGYDSQDTY